MPKSTNKPHAVVVHNVSLKPDNYDALKAQAVERDMTVSELIAEIVAKVVQSEKSKQAA